MNDRMAADDRHLLVPLLPLLVGTRAPDTERARASKIASSVCRVVRPADMDRCLLKIALDWIDGHGDVDDALAVLEVEDQRLAWLCAEVLFGGASEIITTALEWLDHETTSRQRTRFWPMMVDCLEAAIRLGPHSGAPQSLLRERQKRLEAIHRGQTP